MSMPPSLANTHSPRTLARTLRQLPTSADFEPILNCYPVAGSFFFIFSGTSPPFTYFSPLLCCHAVFYAVRLSRFHAVFYAVFYAVTLFPRCFHAFFRALITHTLVPPIFYTTCFTTDLRYGCHTTDQRYGCYTTGVWYGCRFTDLKSRCQ